MAIKTQYSKSLKQTTAQNIRPLFMVLLSTILSLATILLLPTMIIMNPVNASQENTHLPSTHTIDKERKDEDEDENEKDIGDKEPSRQTQARIYRNPEERREAGLGTQVTDWLKVSGLMEIEKEFKEYNYANRIKKENLRPDQTLQIGFIIEFEDLFEAEFIFEAENNKRYLAKLDEGLIGFDIGNWGLQFGRLYIPFGEYYSHFVTGPMLEFGETRASALIVDYSIRENIELAAYIFDGHATDSDQQWSEDTPLPTEKKDNYDWGFAFEYASEDESIRIGTSYLSDLAESDEQFLEEYRHFYHKRVSAWSAYILMGFDQFEITAEILQATNAFVELDHNESKPSAFNLELAYFPEESSQFAIRLEHSNEFSDEPEWQYGVSGTWRIGDNINFSIEYLYVEYKNGFVRDDDGIFLKDRNLIAGQFSIEF